MARMGLRFVSKSEKRCSQKKNCTFLQRMFFCSDSILGEIILNISFFGMMQKIYTLVDSGKQQEHSKIRQVIKIVSHVTASWIEPLQNLNTFQGSHLKVFGSNVADLSVAKRTSLRWLFRISMKLRSKVARNSSYLGNNWLTFGNSSRGYIRANF